MMDTNVLEEEILLWALDGDTINNLVNSEIGLQAGFDAVLLLVQKLAVNDLLRVYIEASLQENNRNVPIKDITADLLSREPYVTLTKTDRTLQRLRELRGYAIERGLGQFW